MGIQGLLQFCKAAHEDGVSVKEYKGRRLGVDVSTWIFRGAYGCASDLGNGADSYVGYCLRRVQVLREHGVTPLFVFDGQRLPMKAAEHAARADSREQSRAVAHEAAARGDHDAAEKAFQRCISVTPEMAKKVMQACDEINVRYMVAPYEADAELAYLQKSGHVAAVITEDSDLLVFGCRETLYKFDEVGTCTRIRLDRVLGPGSELRVSQGKSKRDISFRTLALEQFQRACIFSGCDYLPKKGKDTHVNGIGLKKAVALLAAHSVESAVKLLRATMPAGAVPDGYAEAVERAECTFRYQVVYDPSTEVMRPLNEHPPGKTAADFPFAGVVIDNKKLAKQLAAGKLDPITLKSIRAPPLSAPTLRVVNRIKLNMKPKDFTPESTSSILKFTTLLPRPAAPDLGGGGAAAAATASAASPSPSSPARRGRRDRSPRRQRDQGAGDRGMPDFKEFLASAKAAAAPAAAAAAAASVETDDVLVWVSDSQGESSNGGPPPSAADDIAAAAAAISSGARPRKRPRKGNPFRTAARPPARLPSDPLGLLGGSGGGEGGFVGVPESPTRSSPLGCASAASARPIAAGGAPAGGAAKVAGKANVRAGRQPVGGKKAKAEAIERFLAAEKERKRLEAAAAAAPGSASDTDAHAVSGIDAETAAADAAASDPAEAGALSAPDAAAGSSAVGTASASAPAPLPAPAEQMPKARPANVFARMKSGISGSGTARASQKRPRKSPEGGR